MPCPHFSISICKRSENKSAVASAAYQSGQSLFSERNHRTKAYSNKQGVLFSDILLPEHVPKEYENRAYLWNSVEKNEKSWNAQLARKIVLALPNEVPKNQYAKMVSDYCNKYFVSEGMIADIAIHNTTKGNNPHAHIMLTMRQIDKDGK